MVMIFVMYNSAMSSQWISKHAYVMIHNRYNHQCRRCRTADDGETKENDMKKQQQTKDATYFVKKGYYIFIAGEGITEKDITEKKYITRKKKTPIRYRSLKYSMHALRSCSRL